MVRVLAVDDEENVRILLRERLRQAGHQVLVAGSGEAALEALEDRDPPDVAVLDVSLPGMTGFELASRLQDEPALAETPIIFLSANVREEDIAEGRELGAFYLTKPIVGTALLNAIEKATRDGGGW